MFSWIFGNYKENTKKDTLQKIKRKHSVKVIEKYYLNYLNKIKKNEIRAKRRRLYRRLERTNPNLKETLQKYKNIV